MPSTRTTNNSLSSAAFSPDPSFSALTSLLAYNSSMALPPSLAATSQAELEGQALRDGWLVFTPSTKKNVDLFTSPESTYVLQSKVNYC